MYYVNLKDLKDFMQQMGLPRFQDEHPKFGRYTWKKKFEYFGGDWSCRHGAPPDNNVVPFWMHEVIPSRSCPDSHPVPHMEAVLASLAIFIGHFL